MKIYGTQQKHVLRNDRLLCLPPLLFDWREAKNHGPNFNALLGNTQIDTVVWCQVNTLVPDPLCTFVQA